MRGRGGVRRAVHNDDGSAVLAGLVVLFMVAMMAVVVDAGGLFWERGQLQNGADAAALAVAADCGRGQATHTCVAQNGNDPYATATHFAAANANDSLSAVNAPNGVVVDWAQGEVTVTATSLESGGQQAKSHWVAPLFGLESTQVRASATANWSTPIGASDNSFPMIISICEWNKFGLSLPTPELVVYFHEGTGGQVETCNGPAGQDHPGGFGYLGNIVSGECRVELSVGNWADTRTGNNPPSSPCTSNWFRNLIDNNIEVLVPIFDEVTGTGNNAKFHVMGFAGFQLTGFRLSGGGQWVVNDPCGNSVGGSNSNRCLSGHFTRFVEVGAIPDPSAPNLGATTVRLVR